MLINTCSLINCNLKSSKSVQVLKIWPQEQRLLIQSLAVAWSLEPCGLKSALQQRVRSPLKQPNVTTLKTTECHDVASQKPRTSNHHRTERVVQLRVICTQLPAAAVGKPKRGVRCKDAAAQPSTHQAFKIQQFGFCASKIHTD